MWQPVVAHYHLANKKKKVVEVGQVDQEGLYGAARAAKHKKMANGQKDKMTKRQDDKMTKKTKSLKINF